MYWIGLLETVPLTLLIPLKGFPTDETLLYKSTDSPTAGPKELKVFLENAKQGARLAVTGQVYSDEPLTTKIGRHSAVATRVCPLLATPSQPCKEWRAYLLYAYDLFLHEGESSLNFACNFQMAESMQALLAEEDMLCKWKSSALLNSA